MGVRATATAPYDRDRRSFASLRLHRDASRVPDMQPAEFEALLADVAERGIQTPLDINVIGVVLDGRHRFRCAEELGLGDVPVRVVSAENEVGYMLLAAVNRRQLSPSQRAALVLELEEVRRREEDGRRRSRANLKQNAEVATLPPRQGHSREQTAELAAVSTRTVQDALTVREGDADLFEQVKNGTLAAHLAAKRVRRQRKLEALPAAPPLPSNRSELLYADPPWPSPSPQSPWSPEQHYPTMSIEEIAGLEPLAAEDAILFLWAVVSQLPDALRVMSAWGFEYRSQIVWVKPSIGLGNWVRHRHELLLIGRRGNYPVPDEAARPDSVVEAARGRHSEKPVCFYELIERMYPAASKVELFARGRPRPGWAAWGNEVEPA
jgi:N6-adenosine-specific RNA methylase IME4/ParB-like chromosome segregation protein Spo0J